MTRTGKIARLPHQIRDQLNHRLLDGEKAKVLVPRLNSLPEVLSILTSEFSGRPINSVNLTEWKNGGFRDWLARQEVLEIVHNLNDDEILADKSLKDKFTAQLAHWVAIQLAATARVVIAAETDPQIKWSRLRELCAAIYRLRRGDFDSERLAIDHQWLALEKSNTHQQREKDFWEWVERHDIREKLFPDKDKGLSPETLAKIERELNLM